MEDTLSLPTTGSEYSFCLSSPPMKHRAFRNFIGLSLGTLFVPSEYVDVEGRAEGEGEGEGRGRGGEGAGKTLQKDEPRLLQLALSYVHSAQTHLKYSQ